MISHYVSNNTNILKVEKSPLFTYIYVKRKTGKGSNEFEIKATLPMLINKLKILKLFKNDYDGKNQFTIYLTTKWLHIYNAYDYCVLLVLQIFDNFDFS